MSSSLQGLRDSILVAEGHRSAEVFTSAIEGFKEALEVEAELKVDERVRLRLGLAECLHAKSQYEEAKAALLPILSGSPSPDD